MKILKRLFGLPTIIGLVVGIVGVTFGVSGHAIEWFDDFSDGNADAPPVQWSASPVFAGDYDASSGDYVLTPTDDASQPAGSDDETLIATVNDVVFGTTSIRTQAKVGFGETPDPNRNSDFNASGNVTAGDMLTWQRGIGTGTTQPEGDANFDAVVDGSDLSAWRGQFGGPPNLRGGNVGLVARFNPAAGDGYLLLIDDGSQWNLLAVEGFGAVLIPINDGPDENIPPIDPNTGAPINAETDIMIQLDVTGSGTSNLLEVWFWKPGEPMPAEPFFSRVDDFSLVEADTGVAGIIYNEDDDNTPGIFRSVEASDVHLGPAASAISAVPEPASAVLALLTLLATSLVVRPKRNC